MDELWHVDYEGPDGESIRVFWRWVPAGPGFTCEPFAVEFDLFLTDSEVKELTEALEDVRLDRYGSVSAMAEAEATEIPF